MKIKFADSQLITNGDSQVSIFNYDNGDLLISLDLMKSYGINLTTFEYEEVIQVLSFHLIYNQAIIYILELSFHGVPC